MLKKNAIWIGLLTGILIPLVAFSLLWAGYSQLEVSGFLERGSFSATFRQRTLALVAIALNILPLNRFYKRRHTQSMRGVVIATSIYVIAWVVYFGKYIF